MYRLFCYAHATSPVEMKPEAATRSLYTCPDCGQRTGLVIEEATPGDFNKRVATLGPQSVLGEFGLVQEGSIYYTPAAEASEWVKMPQLREFLEEYVHRYEAADAPAFMELWAEDAVQETDSVLLNQNQAQHSRVAILRNYTRLFHRMGLNKYQLTVTALAGDLSSLTVEGIYRIAYPAASPDPAYYAGLLRLVLRRQPDQPLKIQLLRFQPLTFA